MIQNNCDLCWLRREERVEAEKIDERGGQQLREGESNEEITYEAILQWDLSFYSHNRMGQEKVHTRHASRTAG